MIKTTTRPRLATAGPSPFSRISPLLFGGIFSGTLALGYAVSIQPLAGLTIVALCLLMVLWAYTGTEYVTMCALGTLPWLVLFRDLTPRLTLTLVSAAAVLLLLVRTPLTMEYSWPLRLGVALFGVSLLAQVIVRPGDSELIEAAKYLLFPAMALVVLNSANRKRLIASRNWLIYSGVAVMAIQMVGILLGVTQSGAYYGAGEHLGLSSESPHETALIGVMVALACLLVVRDLRWRIFTAAVAAAPALATGVRSALVALVLSLVILAVREKFRPSVIAGMIALSAAIIVSGAGTIVVNRYEEGHARGEYTSFSKAGSGRGALWETHLRSWRENGASSIAVGNGLRSVQDISDREFGHDTTAQSDLVTVLVEFGVAGFIGWLLIWIALIRSRIEWLVLIPLLTYGIINGSLEYVGAVVFGLALAAACGALPQGTGSNSLAVPVARRNQRVGGES